MQAPSGSSSPVSSKITTPLQSRLQPCSGWLTIVCAASRSGAEGAGQGGVCGHISVPPGCFIVRVRLVSVCRRKCERSHGSSGSFSDRHVELSSSYHVTLSDY